MRFNFKYITIVIVMLNIVQLHGQSYFSTLLPINKYSMNARELAMGGSRHSHGENPAFCVHFCRKNYHGDSEMFLNRLSSRNNSFDPDFFLTSNTWSQLSCKKD